MISLFDAITCITEDKKWISKCVIGSILYMVAALFYAGPEILKEFNINIAENMKLVMYFIYLILSVYFTGFLCKTANRAVNSSEEFQMAKWDEKLMLIGLKASLSISVYILLLVFIMFILYMLVTLICGSFGIIKNINPGTVYIYLTLLCLVVGIICGIYITQLVNTAIACYIKTLKIKDIIAFRKHFKIIKENKHAIWTLIGKNILAFLLFLLIITTLAVSVAGIVLVPFVGFVYAITIFNLLVMYAKEIEIGKYLED